jgi:hypothetical protein
MREPTDNEKAALLIFTGMAILGSILLCTGATYNNGVKKMENEAVALGYGKKVIATNKGIEVIKFEWIEK